MKQLMREVDLEAKKLRASEERLQSDLRALSAVKAAV